MSAFAVAIGVKRTCRCALHMSAFDPKRTLASLNEPHLNRYDIPPVLEGSYEATRISQRFK